MSGVHIAFAGDGPASEMLKELARSHNSFECHFLGWLEDPSLLMSAADVLLLPSRFEGVPLVLLEAIECNIPILASSIDVFQEYLPPSSIFDFETEDLRDALHRTMDQNVSRTYAKALPMTSDIGRPEASKLLFADAVLGPLESG